MKRRLRAGDDRSMAQYRFWVACIPAINAELQRENRALIHHRVFPRLLFDPHNGFWCMHHHRPASTDDFLHVFNVRLLGAPANDLARNLFRLSYNRPLTPEEDALLDDARYAEANDSRDADAS